MFHFLNCRSFRFVSLVLILLVPRSLFPSDYCVGGSDIDQVPFFVEQIYSDILNRAPDPGGRDYWTRRLEDQNSRVCSAANPALSTGECEWRGNAQFILEVLNTSESQSKNGPIRSNSEFVTSLYRVLLRRAPDEAGLRSHVTVLDSGGVRANIIFNFISSDEYRKRFPCHAERQRPTPIQTAGHVELGVNGHPLTQPAYSDSNGVSFDDQLTLIQNLGATWYRFDVGAPSTGGDFSKMDLLVKKAQAHGIQLLPVIIPSIDQAHDSTSAIYQKSHDGAVRIVRRYKDSIHVWELSNEQDAYSMHRAGDPGWSGGGPSGQQPGDYDPERYAAVSAMMRGLAEGVREADGSAMRIIDFAGWLHVGFFQRLEDDHIPYDIVGVHWYQEMEEINCPGQSYPCPAKLQHFNVVQRLQSITHGKPMWMTETNYRPLDSNSVEANVSRKEQYLSPTLERYLSHPSLYPFQKIMIYELLDEPTVRGVAERQFGLFSVTQRPGGGYALGAAKPGLESVQKLFKR